MSANGFEDALKQLKTLVDVNQSVAMESLEEAANYFVDVLRPLLIKSTLNKKHMADGLSLKVEKEQIVVYFEDYAYYWYMKENGHKTGGKRVRGTHTIKNTLDRETKKIEELMLNKITKKMGF